MARETNWGKLSAIAGFIQALISLAGIAVMIWLARQPLPSQSHTEDAVMPLIQTWAWGVSSLYLVGAIGAAVLHWRAAKISAAAGNGAQSALTGMATSATNDEVSSLTMQLEAANKKLQEAEAVVGRNGQSLYETNNKYMSLQLEQKRRRAMSNELWKLKRHAREIRRRWPNSDFAWYPAAKSLWVNPAPVPSVYTDSRRNREWLADAINWHQELRAYIVRACLDESYLGSLDFDELMEYLDKCERDWPNPTECLPPNRPLVLAEYGVNPSRGDSDGFYVWNATGEAAFDVKMVPLRLGNRRIFPSEELPILDSGHGKQFVSLMIQEPEDTLIAPLFDVMNEWRSQADCWGFPLLLRIIYRDSKSNWYMSTFFLEQHADKTDAQSVACRVRPAPAMDESLAYIKG